jgi:hypothetical protein
MVSPALAVMRRHFGAHIGNVRPVWPGTETGDDPMRITLMLVAGLLCAVPALSWAETPIPALPEAGLPAGSRVSDYLRAAEGAVAAGRMGEAESSLEMAQTRLLDRSVPIGQTGAPAQNPLIGQIYTARQALAANDRQGSLQAIDVALHAATAQGL